MNKNLKIGCLFLVLVALALGIGGAVFAFTQIPTTDKLLPANLAPIIVNLTAPSFSTASYTNGLVQFYFVAADSGGATTRSPDYNNNVSLMFCGKP